MRKYINLDYSVPQDIDNMEARQPRQHKVVHTVAQSNNTLTGSGDENASRRDNTTEMETNRPKPNPHFERSQI